MAEFATQYEDERTDRRPLYTINGAALHLDVSRSTVHRLLQSGELLAVRVGKRQRIRPQDMDAYLDRSPESG